jgi:hypothetical protein
VKEAGETSNANEVSSATIEPDGMLSPAGSLRGVLFEKKNASFSKLARANTSSASFVGTFPSRGRLPKGSLWRELSPAGD